MLHSPALHGMTSLHFCRSYNAGHPGEVPTNEPRTGMLFARVNMITDAELCRVLIPVALKIRQSKPEDARRGQAWLAKDMPKSEHKMEKDPSRGRQPY